MTTKKSSTKTTKKVGKKAPTKAAKKSAGSTKKTVAKSSIKPVLTAARVNSRIKSLLGKKGDPTADRLSKDWRAFLASEFSMSRAQSANLQTIPAAEVEMVQSGLRDAVKNGGEFRLMLGATSGNLMVQPADANASARRFRIKIITCTFDAYFRHWHCHLGPFSPT